MVVIRPAPIKHLSTQSIHVNFGRIVAIFMDHQTKQAMHQSKKIIIAFLLLAGTFAGQAQKKNAIKINILSPIVKTFNVQYEAKVKADASFQLGFFYTGYSSSGTDFSGFGVTPEYRMYLGDTEAPEGVYIAPFVRYQNFSLSDFSGKGTLSTFGGGLILGKQWLFKDKIVLDLFIGPSYSSGSVKVTSGGSTFDVPSTLNGFGLRAGMSFGFAF